MAISYEPDLYCLPLAPSTNHEHQDKCCLCLVGSTALTRFPYHESNFLVESVDRRDACRFFFKVPRCFRGFQTLKHRGMVVAGTAQARSFPHFAKTRRFVRATASACRSGRARTLVGVSMDNTYIQRIVRS